MTPPGTPEPRPEAGGAQEVAVAVILRADGCFLLGRRPAGKVYAGYWEFPGGKVEPGEPVADALARELREELGLVVEQAYPWLTRRFVYPHATVNLRFYRVTAWHGELRDFEHEAVAWQSPGRVTVAPLLPANDPVLKALQLPSVLAVTHAGAGGPGAFLERIEGALEGGARLIQIREPELNDSALRAFAREVIARARSHGARVLVNADPRLARDVGADGVHLNAARLMRLERRPDLPWCGASCHDAAELGRAAALELDYAILGPVQATLSHPGSRPMGWARFGELVRDCPLPVFAIGGMDAGCLPIAWRHGGHGVALMRAAWA
jgi:8-oxo-dGTP diphosphatase